MPPRNTRTLRSASVAPLPPDHQHAEGVAQGGSQLHHSACAAEAVGSARPLADALPCARTTTEVACVVACVDGSLSHRRRPSKAMSPTEHLCGTVDWSRPWPQNDRRRWRVATQSRLEKGQSGMGQQPLRRALWRAVGGLALIGLIAVVVLVYTWDKSGSSDRALRDASFNVLAVVLVGAGATLAVNGLQEARADARRIDERAGDFAQRLVVAYNGVKKVRRMLLAEVPEANPLISREVYMRRISELNDFQLEFESLSKRAPGLQARIGGGDEPVAVVASSRKDGSRRSGRVTRLELTGDGAWNAAQEAWPAERCSLKGACDQIERHLNEVIKEFQENLHRVSDDSPAIAVEITPNLAVFIWDTDCFRARSLTTVTGSLNISTNACCDLLVKWESGVLASLCFGSSYPARSRSRR